MENSITANDTLTNMSVLETLGLLFYVASPSGTSFERIEECPDFVNQVIPYIVILIILEAIINHFHRGRPQNLADSVTSISSGLLMTAGGLVTRVAMIRTYEHIYQEHRVVDLPWDSPLTWLCTALLLDLGYYWFHRASHEVGVLWAVHQVHHSSEHFNLTTALRQPVLEGLGWVTHWFYLPLALAVPTTQMLVHTELNFIYQFLIHTELLGDFGILGTVLNTASHHRVHHGANRYCLDKNYGGWLSVWDRMFGTFQEEKQDEDIVYGLVDQPQFFNVITHQLFYFPLLANKTSSAAGATMADHVRKWLYGPGWFPNLNLPRLGDNNLVPERPDRAIHFSSAGLLTHGLCLLQLVGMILAHDELSTNYSSLSSFQVLGLISFLASSAFSIGCSYDAVENAREMEIVR